MTDIGIRVLGEDDWAEYKRARLAALRESPEAFAASASDEEALSDADWQERMRRSIRLLAESDHTTVGVASVATGAGDEGHQADLFGLWVAPASRGTGVASELVRSAVRAAREQGMTHLSYWVTTDNGRAVAFASGFGFRPTDERRPTRLQGEETEEIQMVLPLTGDRGGSPSI
jgi:ribosomal protein S18 acetylase RimI-like enzyme